MNYTEWNGFKRLDFQFEDRNAILVFPKQEGFGTGHWACKMEYFGAFPKFECELLESTWKGNWAIAGSGIFTHTITNPRLVCRGYYDIFDAYKSLHYL